MRLRTSSSTVDVAVKENNPELVFAAQEEIIVATEVVSTQISLADAINQANELEPEAEATVPNT